MYHSPAFPSRDTTTQSRSTLEESVKRHEDQSLGPQSIYFLTHLYTPNKGSRILKENSKPHRMAYKQGWDEGETRETAMVPNFSRCSFSRSSQEAFHDLTFSTLIFQYLGLSSGATSLLNPSLLLHVPSSRQSPKNTLPSVYSSYSSQMWGSFHTKLDKGYVPLVQCVSHCMHIYFSFKIQFFEVQFTLNKSYSHYDKQTQCISLHSFGYSLTSSFPVHLPFISFPSQLYGLGPPVKSCKNAVSGDLYLFPKPIVIKYDVK